MYQQLLSQTMQRRAKAGKREVKKRFDSSSRMRKKVAYSSPELDMVTKPLPPTTTTTPTPRDGQQPGTDSLDAAAAAQAFDSSSPMRKKVADSSDCSEPPCKMAPSELDIVTKLPSPTTTTTTTPTPIPSPTPMEGQLPGTDSLNAAQASTQSARLATQDQIDSIRSLFLQGTDPNEVEELKSLADQPDEMMKQLARAAVVGLENLFLVWYAAEIIGKEGAKLKSTKQVVGEHREKFERLRRVAEGIEAEKKMWHKSIREIEEKYNTINEGFKEIYDAGEERIESEKREIQSCHVELENKGTELSRLRNKLEK